MTWAQHDLPARSAAADRALAHESAAEHARRAREQLLAALSLEGVSDDLARQALRAANAVYQLEHDLRREAAGGDLPCCCDTCWGAL